MDVMSLYGAELDQAKTYREARQALRDAAVLFGIAYGSGDKDEHYARWAALHEAAVGYAAEIKAAEQENQGNDERQRAQPKRG